MPDVIIKGMEMPSRCEDCFAYMHNAEYDYAYCNISSVNVLGKGNARLNNCPLRPAPEWISVEERLPEPGKYLVTHRFYGHTGSIETSIETGSYTNSFHELDRYSFPGNANKRGGWYGYDSEIEYYEDLYVTHWMPLPEPPEGGDGDG